jgi:hypothetical protein
VIRVIGIPTGWARVSYDPSGALGLGVGLERFDDAGWKVFEDQWIWWRRHGKTLSGFLADELELPADETEKLAREIVGEWSAEWERRTGSPPQRFRRGWLAFYLVLTLVSIFAAWGVALTIWLLAI